MSDPVYEDEPLPEYPDDIDMPLDIAAAFAKVAVYNGTATQHEKLITYLFDTVTVLSQRVSDKELYEMLKHAMVSERIKGGMDYRDQHQRVEQPIAYTGVSNKLVYGSNT